MPAVLQGLKLDCAGDELLQRRKSSSWLFHPSSHTQLTEGEVDAAVGCVLADGGITSRGAER